MTWKFYTYTSGFDISIRKDCCLFIPKWHQTIKWYSNNTAANIKLNSWLELTKAYSLNAPSIWCLTIQHNMIFGEFNVKLLITLTSELLWVWLNHNHSLNLIDAFDHFTNCSDEWDEKKAASDIINWKYIHCEINLNLRQEIKINE